MIGAVDMGIIRVGARGVWGDDLPGTVSVEMRPLPGANDPVMEGRSIISVGPIVVSYRTNAIVPAIPTPPGAYYHITVTTDEGEYVTRRTMPEDITYDLDEMPIADVTVPWFEQDGD